MENGARLKRMTYEPKIFALLVSSIHGQILHLGVHFTLEEAYAAAKAKIQSVSVHKIGDSVDIDLWNVLEMKEIVMNAMEEKSPIESSVESLKPTEVGKVANLSETPIIVDSPKSAEKIEDYMKSVRDAKNTLMKQLIERGDIDYVPAVRDLLGTNSMRYVLKAIKEKNKPTTK